MLSSLQTARILTVTVVLGLLSSFAQGAPTPGKVLTPFGERDAENVHLVPAGAGVHHVGDGVVQIIDAGGKVLHSAKPTGNFTKPGHRRSLTTGWIADASWYNPSADPISYFAATWTVPPLPQAAEGQTLFLFNSIEPASYENILQPVLQYGSSSAGGGAYWSIANWYGANGNYFHTDLVEVAPGRVLTGIMQLTAQWFNGWIYQSYFSGIGETMTVYGIDGLYWAAVTLEAYGLVSKNDFPLAWTTFSNMNIKTSAGYPSGVTWGPISTPVDGVSAVVNRQGSQGAQVTIVY
ncbi:hypothetical protein DL93DRAFT_2157674 [Clavulina sp. PMI_390]|nr:hypothetical protein DL93DRAFT_2157674 [Clavulina sp. PMI_390]